jgi:dihydroorotate dehydrogenase electron transfer subunit
VGIVSLFPLAEVLRGRKLFVFIGGRAKEDILCVEDFKKFNANISVATEDGSFGFKGTVVDLFLSSKKYLQKNEMPYIFACGPGGMLKELAARLRSKSNCQVSLEARMGCGFGACWGCVVKTNHPKMPYQRVCKEGPVFRLEEIIWQ